MDHILATVLISILWLVSGSGCIDIWKDMFNEISNRTVRIICRALMLFLWPAWLVFWLVCVAISLVFILIMSIIE